MARQHKASDGQEQVEQQGQSDESSQGPSLSPEPDYSALFAEMPPAAARQAIDSAAVFYERRRVLAELARHAGGMYWKQQAGREYLVRTDRFGNQKSLGARDVETQRAYDAFTSLKQRLEERESRLAQGVALAKKLNKAHRVGRVPPIVCSLLNVIEQEGLGEYFLVVGTHALYAYEMAAGVRIENEVITTKDVDLFGDAKKRVQFLSALDRFEHKAIIKLLRSVDPSFERMDLNKESAITADGFQVDFIRRMQTEDDPHPFRFSGDEDELLPVQALKAGVLNDSKRFEQMVVDTNGRMALMRTVAPQVFADFKAWMSKSRTREPIKRGRDLRQAQIVQVLLDEGLLVEQASDAIRHAQR